MVELVSDVQFIMEVSWTCCLELRIFFGRWEIRNWADGFFSFQYFEREKGGATRAWLNRLVVATNK